MEEIRLNKFREVWSMSIFFITFFGGRFYLTNEFFHFVQIKQQKVKIKVEVFGEFYVWRYKWKTIKIE